MSIQPRYKLLPGRRLTYRSGVPTSGEVNGVGEAKFGDDSTEWQLYVLEQDADGLTKIAFSQNTGRLASGDSESVNVSGLQEEGCFEITEAGRISESATITPLANPAIVLPELPSSEGLAMNGWTSELQVDHTQRQFRGLVMDNLNGADVVRFDETCTTDIDAAYLASRRRTYRLDPERGIIVQVDSEAQRNWPSPRAIPEVIQLVDDTFLDADELRKLTQSAQVYFAARSEYQHLIDSALWDIGECARRLQEAKVVLMEAALGMSHPTTSRWLERKSAILDQEFESLVSESQRMALALDRRSPDWAAIDLDGQQIRSRELRGRVTVLCFWNRGCSWALRTLVALNSLTKEIGGSAVAFAGVCADQDEQSARFVGESLELSFSMVLNRANGIDLAAMFGVEGWPTIVVIDQDGVVRRHRTGYWKAMPSMLLAELKRLESGAHCVGC